MAFPMDHPPDTSKPLPSRRAQPELTPEIRARNRRNIWIALALFAFVLLITLVTIAKLRANALTPHF